MSHEDTTSGSPIRGLPIVDESPLMTLVSAVIFLWVGFFLGLAPTDDAQPLYKFSVWAFVWMGRFVGIALLIVAILGFLKLSGPFAILDAIASVLACAACIFCGGVWLIYGDYDGVLVLLFGIVNGSAARSSIVRLRSLR